jgi:outer membrane protein OmpA-like peptidoglycan-associated protein
MKQPLFNRRNKQIDTENHWTSISDMMSGLMVIFLFIAISLINVEREEKEQIKDSKEKIVKEKEEIEKEKEELTSDKRKIQEIVINYQRVKNLLYEELYEEFKDDLPKWGAEIDKETLTVEFGNKTTDEIRSIYFSPNSAVIKPEFKKVLDDFFFRYLTIIYKDEFRENIEELRIEGHTSSEWSKLMDPMEAYFRNMQLSQERTKTVMRYCIDKITDPKQKEWSIRYLTAIGFSSSQLRMSNGVEDKIKSRRVTFCTKTKAEERIVEILEEMKREEENL